MRVLTGAEQLQRFFAGVTEQVFENELGVADPKLVDYLSDLLVRFARMEAVYRLRDAVGRRLDEVADMLMQAGGHAAHPERELHRHIGDFTLVWSGVYPESLARLRSWERKDALIDYREQGKRSYLIASRFEDERYEDEPQPTRKVRLAPDSSVFQECTTRFVVEGDVKRRAWRKCGSRSGGGGGCARIRSVVVRC